MNPEIFEESNVCTFTFIDVLCIIVIFGIFLSFFIGCMSYTLNSPTSFDIRQDKITDGTISEKEYCDYYLDYRQETTPSKCLHYFTINKFFKN